MAARTTEPCIRCKEMVEISQAAITVRANCRSVGIQPRIESELRQVYCCVECSIAIVMGDEPPKSQPLNMLVYELICQMTAESPAIIVAAWQQLRKRMQLPPVTPNFAEIEILPPATPTPAPLRLAR
jgi:hypothetical protein